MSGLLFVVAAAWGATRVALPAGTDLAGWEAAALSTGVVLSSTEGDVLVTATPGSWLVQVMPDGPAVRVALREWRTRRRPPPQV